MSPGCSGFQSSFVLGDGMERATGGAALECGMDRRGEPDQASGGMSI